MLFFNYETNILIFHYLCQKKLIYGAKNLLKKFFRVNHKKILFNFLSLYLLAYLGVGQRWVGIRLSCLKVLKASEVKKTNV